MHPFKSPINNRKVSLVVPAPRRPIKGNIQLSALPIVQKIQIPQSSRVAPRRYSLLDDTIRVQREPYFSEPISPQDAIQNYSFLLTEREETEIKYYKDIYYIRLVPPAKRLRQRSMPCFFHFVPNDHIAYRYQQLEILGKGSFGTVIKCLDHKTNDYVAIKMLRDDPKVHEEIVFENKIITQLQKDDSPHNYNIIKYIESLTFRGFFCIVMELLWKDTYTVLQVRKFMGFSMNTVRIIAYQTAKALAFMHRNQIVHCDIKPENILFVNNRKRDVKIIDFGCSCVAGKIMFTYIQSRFYRAPEVVVGIPYSKEIDIWSLGCVLCELVTGKPLFDAENQYQLIDSMVSILGMPPQEFIDRGKYGKRFFERDSVRGYYQNDIFPSEPNSSSIEQETGIRDPVFLDLIAKCLQWEPSDRLTAEQLMEHPWLNQYPNV